MSRENVDIVRGMCEAFGRGDWGAGVHPLHPDIEWDTTTMGVWPEAEVLHGQGAVLDFFRRFLGTWEEYHAEFDDYADAGEHVVVSVRDGAVVRFRAYPDRESALEAARSD